MEFSLLAQAHLPRGSRKANYFCAVPVSHFQSTCVTRTSFAIGNTSLKHPYRILHRIGSTIGTDMGDQDRLALAWRNYYSSSALTSLTQIYLLERYMGPIIISEQTLSYSPIEISVDFLKRRPTSVLELILKDNAGVKHKSSQIKEGELDHWNINTFVRLR